MEEELTPEIVRIHAHLCGDGYSCIWKTKEKNRRVTAVTGYCNNNEKLLKKFREDFNKIFNVKMKNNRNREVLIRSVRVYKTLKENFGDFGSRKWRIHNLIKDSEKDLKLEWLKSFFEDEAYHEKRYNRLKIKSMNFNGLKDVKELLDSLNIFSTLTGPNCDESYYLTIPKFSLVDEFREFKKEPIRK